MTNTPRMRDAGKVAHTTLALDNVSSLPVMGIKDMDRMY